MLKAILDTHTIIWYAYNDPRLSETAGNFIDNTIASGDRLGLSAISLVEIIFLSEKNRIPPTTLQEIIRIIHDPLRGLDLLALDEAIAQAMATVPREQVPEMPDRIIAATAVRHNLPVISRDSKIQLSLVPTIW
jgi:PIN domain nuclease of toxin-antitoxin system